MSMRRSYSNAAFAGASPASRRAAVAAKARRHGKTNASTGNLLSAARGGHAGAGGDDAAFGDSGELHSKLPSSERDGWVGSKTEERDEHTSIMTINAFLRVNPRADVADRDTLLGMLNSFVEGNEVAARSPLLRSDEPDDLSTIARLLGSAHTSKDAEMTSVLLVALKILLRKLSNRQAVTESAVLSLINVVKSPQNGSIAKAAANALLNMCYEERNVDMVLDSGGAEPLVKYLDSPDEELCASTAGALQSICFQRRGRDIVRGLGVLPKIVKLLSSKSETVLSRVVGALHNLSSDPSSISLIRDEGAVEPLVALLKAPMPTVCGSAAGALQNLSRETAAREVIAKCDAVPGLIDLLFASDVQAQACAAGALLNIVGPTLESEDPSNPERVAFKSLLSDSIALGAASRIISTEPAPASD